MFWEVSKLLQVVYIVRCIQKLRPVHTLVHKLLYTDDTTIIDRKTCICTDLCMTINLWKTVVL